MIAAIGEVVGERSAKAVLFQRAKLIGQFVVVLCMLGVGVAALWWALHPGVRTTGAVVKVQDGECTIQFQDTDGTFRQTYDPGYKWWDCDAQVGDTYDVWFDPEDPEDALLDGPASNAVLSTFYFVMAAGFSANLWWRVRRGAWHVALESSGSDAAPTEDELEAQFPVETRAERIIDWLERHLAPAETAVARSLVGSGDGIGAVELLLRVLSDHPAQLSDHEKRLLRDLIEPSDALSAEARSDLQNLVGGRAGSADWPPRPTT